jgi:hypothetical protein
MPDDIEDRDHDVVYDVGIEVILLDEGEDTAGEARSM